MSKTPACSWLLRVRAAGRCEPSHCTHAVSKRAQGTDQRLPGSNGAQCSIIPIFLIFAFLPLPTDRMDHWQSRRAREREREHGKRNSWQYAYADTLLILSHSTHTRSHFECTEDTSMKKHLAREKIININKNKYFVIMFGEIWKLLMLLIINAFLKQAA